MNEIDCAKMDCDCNNLIEAIRPLCSRLRVYP